jgi:cold shock protein
MSGGMEIEGEASLIVADSARAKSAAAAPDDWAPVDAAQMDGAATQDGMANLGAAVAPSAGGAPMEEPPIDEAIVSGRVKWFDPVRGYGFMVPADGQGSDILVHFTVVRDTGRRTLPEGATLTCSVIARERGRQARRIFTIDLSTAIGPDPETAAQRASDRVDPQAMIAAAGSFEDVTVKWFNRLKGYGFVVRPGSVEDIFIHMETVRRANLPELEPGQTLRVRVAPGHKGPLAVLIEAPGASA